MQSLESALAVIGRFLLGLYFLLPGISKVTGFAGVAAYMEQHGMVFVPFFFSHYLDSANWRRAVFNCWLQSSLYRTHVCRDDPGHQHRYA